MEAERLQPLLRQLRHRGLAAMTEPLKDKVVLMSGGSRGIGEAIAVRLADEGANVAIVAKTDQPHPKLPGTIHTAAAAIEEAGGKALPILGDVRDESQVEAAVARTIEEFGGIDIVVNNASAINLAPMRDLEPKRFDLMQQINSRGTFVFTRAALPHLRESSHAHVLTLSPPLSVDRRWLKSHSAYTLSKMGMSMITLGVAADEAESGIAANCLWPRTLIATAAVQNLLGGDAAMAQARTPAIVADAAAVILARDPRECTGNTFIDDEVLGEAGVTDLDQYLVAPGGELALDLFVESF
jgi:citronellol/citronellal dehydrogenase